MNAIALIDGEHHGDVVRDALAELPYEFVGAILVGGTEKLRGGEDYGVPVGTNLASMSTGTVVFAGVESGYGNLVQIRYWEGTVSYYGHMSAISVNVGESVEPGQVVGLSGNTGHSGSEWTSAPDPPSGIDRPVSDTSRSSVSVSTSA